MHIQRVGNGAPDFETAHAGCWRMPSWPPRASPRSPCGSAAPKDYSFCLFDQIVTGVTDFSPVQLVEAKLRVWPQEGNMASKPRKLGFIFAAVFVVAAFVAINSWAAVTKHESAAPIAAKGTIYRPDLWKVY